MLRAASTALMLALVLLLAGCLCGCVETRMVWTDGTTFERRAFASDTKIGSVEYSPQTGSIKLENYDTQSVVARELAGLARDLAAPPGAP